MTARMPSVTAVVPSHDRPELLRRAVRSIVSQDYPGELTVVVVYDGTEPDHRLVEEFAPADVRVIANTRTRGLCGARNTGILVATTEWVAFCDDDDEWLPGKLLAQVTALQGEPEAEFASTSMAVRFKGTRSVRLAGTDRVTHAHLVRSRMAMLHSSSFLVRRSALLDGIGLLDENIPGSMSEDWDLLLRAARRRPVVHVDQPLVEVLWGSTSFFTSRWEMKVLSSRWMFERHPEIGHDAVGAGRLLGQMAFAEAAMGRRRAAVRTASGALRRNPREPRAFLAVAVACGVPPSVILRLLHLRGHGV
jgi:glycosyltransferase involved in cell wall biosynthesis